MSYFLEFRRSDGQVSTLALSPDSPISVGSASTNDVRIVKPDVADHHCVFLLADGEPQVVSRSRACPTLVAGRLVEGSVALHDGDRIDVGPIAITLRAMVGVAADTGQGQAGPFSADASREVRSDDPGRLGRPQADIPSVASVQKTPSAPHGRAKAAKRSRRWPIVASIAVFLILLGVAAQQLGLAERYSRNRHLSALHAALEKRAYRQAADLAKEYLRKFPNAEDAAGMTEKAEYATLLDELSGTPAVSRLKEILERIDAFLQRGGDAGDRNGLLKRAIVECVSMATSSARRSDTKEEDVAELEGLLRRVQGWTARMPVGSQESSSIRQAFSVLASQHDVIRHAAAMGELKVLADAALSKGATNEFFDRLRDMRSLWPKREIEAELAARVNEVAEAERKSASLKIEAGPMPSPAEFATGEFRRLAVSFRRTIPRPTSKSQTVWFVAQGSTVYALDRVSGELIWSRTTRQAAAWEPVAWTAKGLVLSADGGHGIAAWDANSGVGRWRIDTGATVLGPPFIDGEFLYAHTAPGEILRLSHSGELTGRFSLRQRFEQAGAFDPFSHLWTGVDALGTLYRINLERGACLGIVHHAATGRTITHPPLSVGPFVFLFDADCDRKTTIRVLKVAGSEAELHRTYTLDGWLPSSCIACNGVLAVPTDNRKVHLFGCNTKNAEEGVFPIGVIDTPGVHPPIVAKFDVSLDAVRMLLLLDQPVQIEYGLMDGQTRNVGVQTDASFKLGGEVLNATTIDGAVFVRAANGSVEGSVLTCLNSETPQDARWQAVIGECWLPTHMPERGDVLLSQQGTVADLPALAADSQAQPPAQLVADPGLRDGYSFEISSPPQIMSLPLIRSEGGLTANSPKLAAFDYDNRWVQSWERNLKSAIGAWPVQLGDLVLVAYATGEVELFAAASGQPTGRLSFALAPCAPNRPRRLAGPAVVAPDTYLIGDTSGLYVLRATGGEFGHTVLALKDSCAACESIVDVVSAGSHVYAVDATGRCAILRLPDLQCVEAHTLEAGSRLLRLPDSQDVLSYSPQGSITRLSASGIVWSWRSAAIAAPVGPLCVAGEKLVLTLSNGNVCVLSAASGELLATDATELCWAGPIQAMHGHLVGTTRSGEVWAQPQPAKPASRGDRE